ncbi:MAG: hypothetical protein V3V13_04495 [Paracoccaceae bacterium]
MIIISLAVTLSPVWWNTFDPGDMGRDILHQKLRMAPISIGRVVG